MPQQRPRLGFTLIELLVVSSIIALLIGILLPALGAARKTARNIACASNQRQLGIAMFIYVTENKDYFPPSVYTNNEGLTIYWHQAFQANGSAVGLVDPDNNNAVCPADDDPWNPFSFTPDENIIANSSYGANPFLMINDVDGDGLSDTQLIPSGQPGAGTRVKLRTISEVISSSETFAFGDVRSDEFFDGNLPNTDQGLSMAASERGEWAWERHDDNYEFGDNDSGLANATYADGHGGGIRASNPTDPYDRDITGLLNAEHSVTSDFNASFDLGVRNIYGVY
ncbi:MAG: prepilin-type N-terminal cleavage/methylation domain-containing protein [Planctomycetota bacterium]